MPPLGGGREQRVWWTRAKTSHITTQSKEPMSEVDESRMAAIVVEAHFEKWR